MKKLKFDDIIEGLNISIVGVRVEETKWGWGFRYKFNLKGFDK